MAFVKKITSTANSNVWYDIVNPILVPRRRLRQTVSSVFKELLTHDRIGRADECNKMPQITMAAFVYQRYMGFIGFSASDRDTMQFSGYLLIPCKSGKRNAK